MILIDNVGVEKEILDAPFLCDLKNCKGACCTFPGKYGAPVLEDEVFRISDNLKEIMKYMQEDSIKFMKKKGFIQGAPDSYTTTCIDDKECVFVTYDGDVAKCAIEKAFHDGKSDFRKPVSCHLFPVRENDFGGTVLYYEKIEECDPGITHGRNEKVKMIEMLKEALIRRFGEDWYNKLLAEANK